MRVQAPGAPGSIAAPRSAGPSAGAKPFPQLIPARALPEPSRAVGAAPAAALGLWLAMQALPDAAEKRRRAIRRGHGLLDRLEELERALLDGSLTEALLQQLRLAAPASDRSADDPRLDALLAQIEIRAAVELAKLEVCRG